MADTQKSADSRESQRFFSYRQMAFIRKRLLRQIFLYHQIL